MLGRASHNLAIALLCRAVRYVATPRRAIALLCPAVPYLALPVRCLVALRNAFAWRRNVPRCPALPCLSGAGTCATSLVPGHALLRDAVTGRRSAFLCLSFMAHCFALHRHAFAVPRPA